MRLLKNQPMVQQLSSNIAANEMSNVAMVLQTPTIIATWYRINPDLSRLVDGWDNIRDFISPESTVVYDKIENFPLCGVENLTTQAQFDDEMGTHEDFQSSGVVYPKTVYPIPNSFFTINDAEITALYVVTEAHPVTLRSNPFIEFSFKLYSRDPEVIKQLNRQVRDVYTTLISTVGMEKSLVIAKSALNDLSHHVEQYAELSDMYSSLFYDRNKATFVFDGLPDPDTGEHRATFIDMTLWKFMFDEGIIIYDDVITYASNNMGKSSDRIYTDCPDILVDDHLFHRSILWRLYKVDKRSSFDEYRYPQIYEGNPRVTKYQGLDIWYLEAYVNNPCNPEKYGTFYIWDDEFLCRIRNNDPYDEVDLRSGICTGCREHCHGKPVTCYNPFLRNVVIKWFNGDTDIDWDNIQVIDERTIENYYLIPLVLGIYKQHIVMIQNEHTQNTDILQ